MPFRDERDQIRRRREVLNAIMEKSMQPYKQQTAGGYVIPYGFGDAANTIGSALIAKYQGNKLDEEEEDLTRREREGLVESTKRIMETATGRPGGDYRLSEQEQFGDEQIPGLKDEPIEPDLNKAALMAVTDPNLSENRGVQNVIAAMLKGKAAGSSLGVQFLPTEKGYAVGDRATGKISLPEDALMRDSSSVPLQGKIAGSKEQGKKDVQLVMDPQIAKEKKIAEYEAEKQITKNQKLAKLDIATKRLDLLETKVGQIKGSASLISTGLANQLTGWVAGTPASDMNLDLSTIKAIAGFEELRQLKDLGGTLGQVSNFENEMLQAVWGNVMASQSKDQFLRNMDIFIDQARKSVGNVRTAYERDYGSLQQEAVPKEQPIDTNNLINMDSDQIRARANEILNRK